MPWQVEYSEEAGSLFYFRCAVGRSVAAGCSARGPLGSAALAATEGRTFHLLPCASRCAELDSLSSVLDWWAYVADVTLAATPWRARTSSCPWLPHGPRPSWEIPPWRCTPRTRDTSELFKYYV